MAWPQTNPGNLFRTCLKKGDSLLKHNNWSLPSHGSLFSLWHGAASLSHIYYRPPLRVFGFHSLFLYSDMLPPHCPLLAIGWGNFEPNIYLYKYPSNLVPVIIHAYTTYEDGTDWVLRNVGTYNSDAGESPERKNTTYCKLNFTNFMLFIPCITVSNLQQSINKMHTVI